MSGNEARFEFNFGDGVGSYIRIVYKDIGLQGETNLEDYVISYRQTVEKRRHVPKGQCHMLQVYVYSRGSNPLLDREDQNKNNPLAPPPRAPFVIIDGTETVLYVYLINRATQTYYSLAEYVFHFEDGTFETMDLRSSLDLVTWRYEMGIELPDIIANIYGPNTYKIDILTNIVPLSSGVNVYLEASVILCDIRSERVELPAQSVLFCC
ncbi:uncharacterized protein LOC142356035 [Convolutriloba macropyga]|uniref:uncharacterized protein LOC142356035 n=1 Tax=Convolutriloba macropyga TaxID=536237 RepID=UPI003F524F66